MGQACDKLLEACMTFDLAADYYIDNGLGREITKRRPKISFGRPRRVGWSIIHRTTHEIRCSSATAAAVAARRWHTSTNTIIPRLSPTQTTTQGLMPKPARPVKPASIGVRSMPLRWKTMYRSSRKTVASAVDYAPQPATESITMIHKQQEDLTTIFENQDQLLQTMAKEKNKNYPFQ